ncbi:hypothetical protein D3C85_1731120 [compost metagenome]
MKMTDMAFSSTVKASELKKIIVTSSTQPRAGCSMKRASSATSARDCPGSSHSR